MLLLAIIINNKLVVKSSFLYKVEYPNPEEGASSLDLAFRTAEASGARLQFLNKHLKGEPHKTSPYKIFCEAELSLKL